MFRGEFAKKDASKVNVYEVAQLAVPAKSCAEMERTSKGEGWRGKEAEMERQIVLV